MFTGLVQASGTLSDRNADSIIVTPPDGFGAAVDPWKLGESVAINGCCLTLVDSALGLKFELSPETMAKTTFGSMPIGSRVNIERAVKVGDRLGGHIVQGHVDGTAKCIALIPHSGYHEFVFETDRANDRYLIEKGSISVDGISLTVVTPMHGRFSCWIIPTTYAETNLGSMQVGQKVHLEIDMIAKHVEKLLEGR